MAEFEWLPSECAPRDYPAELLEGHLLFADGDFINVPEGRLTANGWGELGSTRLVGERLKPLPVGMELLWLSIAEGVFYRGQLDLPGGRLARLMGEGFFDPMEQKQRSYDKIIAGMAPGGDMQVWLSDGGAFCRSVMGGAAGPGAIEWSRYQPGLEKAGYLREAWAAALPRARRAEVMDAPVPLGQWGQWRRRFGWSPSVQCPGRPEFLWIASLNGERELYAAPEWEDPWTDRAAPGMIRASWQAGSGATRVAEITFDPDESFAALSRFSEGRAADLGKIALEVEISGKFHDAAVTLRDSQLALPLEKCKVEVFRR